MRKYAQQVKILRKKPRMISFPLLLLVVATIIVFRGGMWISEKRASLYAPPPVDRIYSQEDLPAELQQKLAPTAKPGSRDMPGQGYVGPVGPTARAVAPQSTAREADIAIRKATDHLEEAERTRGAAAPIEVVQNAEPEGMAQEVPDAPARLALTNSAEAVAEDRPDPIPDQLQKHRFAVEADEKVWIQVRIDDKHTKSAMLHAGDKREWIADKNIQVVVGNAGGILMKWNDRAISAPRDPGRVLRFRLPDYAEDEG